MATNDTLLVDCFASILLYLNPISIAIAAAAGTGQTRTRRGGCQFPIVAFCLDHYYQHNTAAITSILRMQNLNFRRTSSYITQSGKNVHVQYHSVEFVQRQILVLAYSETGRFVSSQDVPTTKLGAVREYII